MDRHTLRSRLVAGLGVASLATAPLMAPVVWPLRTIGAVKAT